MAKRAVKLKPQTEAKLKELLHKMQTYKTKAMSSLQSGDLGKASLMFNLDARNSDEISELLKKENDGSNG
jgi:hypothetical protein